MLRSQIMRKSRSFPIYECLVCPKNKKWINFEVILKIKEQEDMPSRNDLYCNLIFNNIFDASVNFDIILESSRTLYRSI